MLRFHGLVFCLLFAAISFHGFAQKNVVYGYIITQSNDTLNGFIDLKSNLFNSRTCIFQHQAGETSRSYTPEEIKAFRTSSKYYISKEIEIDSTKQKVFLEYLVDGIVDLFYLKDVLNEYYFIEKDDKLIPLSNNETSILIEGNDITTIDKTYIKNSNQYKGVLNYLFQDGEGMTGKISGTAFQYKSLINLTKDYHNAVCSEYECIDYSRSTVQPIFLQFGAGLVASRMDLKTSKNHDFNVRPMVGMQLRFVPWKSLSRWHFLLGLSYSSNNFRGFFANDLYSGFATDDTFYLTADYTVLRIPLNLEYIMGNSRLQPFISIGYNANIFFDVSYAAYKHWHNLNFEEFTHLRRYQHGITGGVGLKYNNRKGNYFYLKSEIEYRVPSANGNYVMDYVRCLSWLTNFGYAFAL